MPAFFFLTGCLPLQNLFLSGAGLLKSVIIAAVSNQPAAVKMNDIAAQQIENMAVVADNQQSAAIFFQMIFQPERSLQIQVVGRLIQQQNVRRTKQRRGQCQAHSPAAGKFAYRTRQIFMREPQTVQNFSSSGFGCRRANDIQTLMNCRQLFTGSRLQTLQQLGPLPVFLQNKRQNRHC